MRVLCLHGQGSSPEILQAQSRGFRALLPGTWDFVFVEAPETCEAGPGIEGIYPAPYYCFFSGYAQEHMLEAVDYVDEVYREDGPFDGIMGFSQGASVAAAFAAKRPNDLKFAIFLCAALIDPKTASASELIRTIGELGYLDLPSLHVLGARDICYSQSAQLAKSCDPNLSDLVVHNGGHDIPLDKPTSKSIANGVEKLARRALSRF